jgi:hypothetical protein
MTEAKFCLREFFKGLYLRLYIVRRNIFFTKLGRGGRLTCLSAPLRAPEAITKAQEHNERRVYLDQHKNNLKDLPPRSVLLTDCWAAVSESRTYENH